MATAYDPKTIKNFLGHYNSFMALTKDAENRGFWIKGNQYGIRKSNGRRGIAIAYKET